MGQVAASNQQSVGIKIERLVESYGGLVEYQRAFSEYVEIQGDSASQLSALVE